LNDPPSIALVKINLADALRHVGEAERADVLCTEALEIARELGSKGLAALALNVSGRLSLARGDGDAAQALLVQSFDLSVQAGDKQLTADCLEALGGVAATCDRPEHAAQLFGAADALREAIGASLQDAYKPEHERYVRAAKERLAADTFAAAWAAGRTISPDEISRQVRVVT
jgi:tetratricopeptide (TPR) repeat protein